jgi:hypothetical protein
VRFTLKQLQDEQRAWVAHNFPGRESWQPLMGIVEEFGELCDAGPIRTEGQRNPEADDALADIVIFLADYCSAMGWELEAVAMRKRQHWQYEPLSRHIGKLCHHHLKRHEGIRGDAGHHDAQGQLAAAKLWSRLCWKAGGKRVLMKLVKSTWAKVRQRDWRNQCESTSGASRCCYHPGHDMPHSDGIKEWGACPGAKRD